MRPQTTSTAPLFSRALAPQIQCATKTKKKKSAPRSSQERYALAQAEAERAARKESRRAARAKQAIEWGDPVYGATTPFVESFDSAGQATFSTPRTDADGNPLEEPHPLPTSPDLLTHNLTRTELAAALDHGYQLTLPDTSVPGMADPEREAAALSAHAAQHSRASAVLERVFALTNSGSQAIKHANIRRCVEEFGRHNTDKTLRPQPLAAGQAPVEKPPRAGKDTGSSEVQIALLTIKIRKLAKELSQNRGYKDKINKRNLTVLVHRRQRLLRYMERKERGSERWTHMLEKLGLTPVTWKGQIVVKS